MNILWHTATAVPFLLAGHPLVALGCVLPDVTWLAQELRFRLSGEPDWHVWIETCPERHLVLYRTAHSVFTIGAVAVFFPELAAGWALHLMLDLPTHTGRMRQRPVYPFSWRWPWTF